MKIQQSKIEHLRFLNPFVPFFVSVKEFKKNGTNANKGIVIIMKKLKLLVIAVTVLLLALFMFSCTASPGGDASREETSEDLKFETEQKTETEEYKRAASAVISLDEDAEKEIMHYLGYKSERKLFDLSDDTTYTSPRCYGEFNGCAVLAVRLGRLMETAKTVGESEFSSTYDIALFGYFDNTMYDLEDAYKNGIINAEEVEKAAKNHKAVEMYLNKAFNTEYEVSDELLGRIAKDYFNYHVENFDFDPELDGAVYVERCYGTYSGAVPVLMRGTGWSYAAVNMSETVAGYWFDYSDSKRIEVWKDGEFYTLQEAYDKEVLTKEDILKLSIATYVKYDYTEHFYPTPESGIGPKEADEATLKQIAKDYYDYCVDNGMLDPDSNGAYYVSSYYTTYKGAVPVVIRGTHIEVDISSYIPEKVSHFECGCYKGEARLVWKDGEFYSFTEAFEKGILTSDKLAIMFNTSPTECQVMEYGYPE